MAGKAQDDSPSQLPVRFQRIVERADHEDPVPRSLDQALSVLGYGPQGYVEQELQNPEQVREYLNKWPVVWINVDGLGDYSAIRKFGEMFNLHPLAIEDVINLHQRAKVDNYDDHQYIVVRLVAYDRTLATEQISIFLTKDMVLSVTERPGGDSFDNVRERIRADRGSVRRARADYLAYALLDAAIDGYFPVLEQYGEQLDSLEDEIIQSPSKSTITTMHRIKRNLLATRRAVWPMRELVNSLIRDESRLINKETTIYFRDTYDHVIRVLDLVETYRELCSDLMDVYLSSVSNRLNEIMKVLTVITVIFIPPTFIAGIYGMNFNTRSSPFNMPELNWYFGYPLALAMMAIFVVIQIIFMYRRGWLTFDEFSRVQLESQPAANQTSEIVPGAQ